jgi:hypothetical protein
MFFSSKLLAVLLMMPAVCHAGRLGNPGRGPKDQGETGEESSNSVASIPSISSDVTSISEDSVDDRDEEFGGTFDARKGNGQGHVNKGGNGNGLALGLGNGNNKFADVVNITCTGDIDFSCDLPPKQFQNKTNTQDGVFVCRQKVHPVFSDFIKKQFPICIASNMALESDECGCCGSVCPRPCSACPCSLGNSTMEGVEVLITGMEEPVCVPKFASMMMVYKSDNLVICNTQCSGV